MLRRALPVLPPRAVIPYGTLLASVFAVIARHRKVQVTLLMNAAASGAFMMFWTGLTFLLNAPPFSYSVTQIGLVGLVGLAGALTARRAGVLHDRGWSVPATGVTLTLMLASFILANLGEESIVALLAVVLLLDVAFQGTNILNQTRVLSVDPSARSRLIHRLHHWKLYRRCHRLIVGRHLVATRRVERAHDRRRGLDCGCARRVVRGPRNTCKKLAARNEFRTASRYR